MKKVLLTFVAAIGMAAAANAQATRLSLYEEYTGENCDPCAADNPALWALFATPSNASKILDITYMEPVPSTGWFYQQNTPVNDARMSYYQTFYNIVTGMTGEVFTPSGVQDGHIPDGSTGGNAMNVAEFAQADIDSMAGVTAPFNITVTNSWDATFSNITSVVTITNASTTTAYAPAGANFYLRLALVENVVFSTPPGTNGEDTFRHVVRQMFPSALGTTIPETWAPGASQSYTITGACPSYVNKSHSPFMVAWVQNDNDLSIEQAAQATPLPALTNDGALLASNGPSGLICNANGAYSVNHNVILQNEGSSTLTSATIYYSVDGGTMSNYAWTGSLAASASMSVAMPAVSVNITGASTHSIYDSVAQPNGATDYNINNNPAGGGFFIESTTGLAMPYYTSFENSLDSFYEGSLSTDGANWGIYNNGTGTSLAHTGANAAMFECYAFPTGDQAVLTFPEVTTSTSASLSFWVAYAQYSGTENDKLEAVYSSDCGTTWTSLWSAAGASLSTAPADGTSDFIPTSSQYVQHTVSLSTVPAGSIIAFRATSDYGNDMWVDDINIASSTGVNQVTQSSLGANIYPNPAKDEATLSFNLTTASAVQVQVVDGLGRILNVVANDKMDAGAHTLSINTASLASGVYNVMIHTDGGTFTERLSVVK